jgi:hypothetical protein
MLRAPSLNNERSNDMSRQLITLAAVLTTAAVVAAGGVAVAQGGTSTRHAKATPHAAKQSSRGVETTGPDTDSIQSGDQTTPDAAKAAGASGSETATSETGGEPTGSEESPSDGPGGHEDAPGAEADHQFEGVE